MPCFPSFSENSRICRSTHQETNDHARDPSKNPQCTRIEQAKKRWRHLEITIEEPTSPRRGTGVTTVGGNDIPTSCKAKTSGISGLLKKIYCVLSDHKVQQSRQRLETVIQPSPLVRALTPAPPRDNDLKNTTIHPL